MDTVMTYSSHDTAQVDHAKRFTTYPHHHQASARKMHPRDSRIFVSLCDDKLSWFIMVSHIIINTLWLLSYNHEIIPTIIPIVSPKIIIP